MIESREVMDLQPERPQDLSGQLDKSQASGVTQTEARLPFNFVCQIFYVDNYID